MISLSVVCMVIQSLEWARMELGDGGRSMEEEGTEKSKFQRRRKGSGAGKEPSLERRTFTARAVKR